MIIGNEQTSRPTLTPTLVCFSHHKCASQYTRRVFEQVMTWLGITFQSVVAVDDPTAPLPNGTYRQMLQVWRSTGVAPTAEALYIGNATKTITELLNARGGYRGFHVIRDPRDILISGYFSHRYSHPTTSEWGKRLAVHREQLAAAPSLEAGLLLELDFSASVFSDLAGWRYDDPNVYETRYERLTTEPWNTFLASFQFLGINVCAGKLLLLRLAMERKCRRLLAQPMRRTCLPQPILHRILASNAFEQHSGGRTKGAEDPQHHYRKGIAGDWRNYFTPKVTNAFKARYGDLLLQLAYESTLDW